jgi:hypothetical protein
MLFGSRGTPARQPWETPGYGDGTGLGGGMPEPMQPQMSPMDTYQRIAAISGQQAAPEQPNKHAGLHRAAGIFSDFLSGLNGQQGQYLPMLQKQKEAEREAVQYQQHRADAYSDWQKQADYTAAHKPVNYDTFQQAMVDGGIQPGTPQWVSLSKQRAATLATPAPQMVGSLDTGYNWVTPPPPQIMGDGAAGMPKVTDQASYDALPAGATYTTPDGHTRTKGGGVSNGAGGFP